MDWSQDSLWNKAKLYAERAFSERRTSSLFPLLATIALEFLGRATLAKVNPVLLADPRGDDHILYACGYGSGKMPKSVSATTVFRRCQSIIPDFTQADLKSVMILMDKRNAELHSGELPYEDFPTQLWLTNYFRVCRLLLDFLGFSLEELFGEEDGRTAYQMIEAAAENRKAKVLKRIAAHRTIFGDWSAEEQQEKRETGKMRLVPVGHPSKEVSCPSCGSRCRITGEEVRAIDRLEDDELVREIIVLPTYLHCLVCNLELRGYEALQIAELGGQFTVEKPIELAEYYFDYDDYDPADRYDADEGDF